MKYFLNKKMGYIAILLSLFAFLNAFADGTSDQVAIERNNFIQVMMHRARSTNDMSLVPAAIEITNRLRNVAVTRAEDIQEIGTRHRNYFRALSDRAQIDPTFHLNPRDMITQLPTAISGIPGSVVKMGLLTAYDAGRSLSDSYNEISTWQKFQNSEMAFLSEPVMIAAFGAAFDAGYAAPIEQRAGIGNGFRFALGQDFHVDMRDYLQRNPDMAMGISIGEIQTNLNLLSSNQAQGFSEIQNDFNRIVQDFSNHIRSDVDSRKQYEQRIQEIQNSILSEFERNREIQRVAQLAVAEQEQRQQERQMIIQGFRGSIFMLSSMANTVDPVLGRQMQAIGESAIVIEESIRNITNISSGAANFATTMGTVAATGNIIGAVMNIASLFGDSSESSMSQISRSLRSLRSEIANLRTEMHARFDKIDVNLNAIHTDLLNGLNELIASQNVSRTQMERINSNLSKIGNRLSRVERTINEYQRAEIEFTQRVSENRYLNSESFMIPNHQSFDRYTDAMELFFNLATTHARGPVFQNTYDIEEDLTPENATVRLGRDNANLYANLSYIGAYAHDILIHPPVSNSIGLMDFERLPNPLAWSRGAEALISLIAIPSSAFRSEFSLRRRDAHRRHLNELIDSGQQLTGFFSQLSNTRFLNADAGERRDLPLVLSKMMTDYQSAAENVATFVNQSRQSFEHLYLNDLSLNRIHQVDATTTESKNPYTSFELTQGSIPPCEGVRDLVSRPVVTLLQHQAMTSDLSAPLMRTSLVGLPANARDMIPSEIREAQQLGLGDVTFCYDYDWKFVRTESWDAPADTVNLGIPIFSDGINWEPQMRLYGEWSSRWANDSCHFFRGDLRSTLHFGNLLVKLKAIYTQTHQPALAREAATEADRQNSRVLVEIPQNSRVQKIVAMRTIESEQEWNYHEVLTSSDCGHNYYHHSPINDFPDMLARQWASEVNLKNQFATRSTSITVPTSIGINLNLVSESSEQLYNVVRQGFTGNIRAMLADSTLSRQVGSPVAELNHAVDAMVGYRSLVLSVIELILPISLRNDDAFRSVVYGSDSIGSKVLLDALLSRATVEDSASFRSVMENIRVAPSNQISNLKRELERVLIAENRRETHPLIQNTLDRLQALRTILNEENTSRGSISDAYTRLRNRIEQLL